MKHLLFSFLLSMGCAATQVPSVKSKKAFTSFSHLKQKKAKPFQSTFLNPVFVHPKRTKNKFSVMSNGPLQSTAYLWFATYQNTLSRLDGSTCNFSPTCSGFGLKAISKYGPLGFGLALGRLHKNHLDTSFYNPTRQRLSDPLTNYTFWLRSPKADNFAAHRDPAHAWYQHVSLVDE